MPTQRAATCTSKSWEKLYLWGRSSMLAEAGPEREQERRGSREGGECVRREARRREHATAAIRHCNHRVGRTIRPSPAAPSRSAIPFRSQYCNSPNNGACGGGSHIQVDSPTARAEASPHLDCAAPKEGARDRGRAFNGSRLHAPETLAWAATPGERKWWLSPRVDLDWRLAWRFPRFCGRGGRGGGGEGRLYVCVGIHRPRAPS